MATHDSLVTPCSGLEGEPGALCAQGLGTGVLPRSRRRRIPVESDIEVSSRIFIFIDLERISLYFVNHTNPVPYRF